MPDHDPSPEREINGLAETILDDAEDWRREEAADRLLSLVPSANLSVYGHEISEILADSDPEIRLWRLAAAIVAAAGDDVPREIRALAESTATQGRSEERSRDTLLDSLRTWTEERSQTFRRNVRAQILFTADSDTNGFFSIEIEPRVTTRRLKNAKRSTAQIENLLGQVQESEESMADEERKLLELVLAGEGETPSPPLLDHLSRLDSLSWSDESSAALARRTHTRLGVPARIASEGARLLPTIESGAGGAALSLSLVRRGLPSAPLSEIAYCPGIDSGAQQRAGLVLWRGTLYPLAEEAPRAISEPIFRDSSMPLPDDTTIIRELKTAFPEIADQIIGNTRHHDARVAIALDLRNHDWLQVRLFATTHSEEFHPAVEEAAEGYHFEYDANEGWRALALPTIADVATEHRPQPELVEVGIDWLGGLESALGGWTRQHSVPWDDRGIGHWVRISANRLEAFTEQWKERPEEAAIFASPETKRLFSRERPRGPKISVKPQGVDWLEIAIDWGDEARRLDHEDLARLRNAKTRFVRLAGGWIDREQLAEEEEILVNLANLGIDASGDSQLIPLSQLCGAELATFDDLEDLAPDDESRAAVRLLAKKAGERSQLENVPLPESLDADLRSYQHEGLSFLARATESGLGAILADDMGLGKTLQALALITRSIENDPEGGPTLVICPASVMHNWKRETRRFSPAIHACTLESGPERHSARANLGHNDLAITNYALLRRDGEELAKIPWRAVILDEAQNIKNPDAAVTKAAHRLDAPIRLALTGTPLENRALDLYSITTFVQPGYLGSRNAFEAAYDRGKGDRESRTRLSARLRPILLRRTKSEVAPELPPRMEIRRDCEFTEGQRQLYLAELQESRKILERMRGEGNVNRERFSMLSALTRLRQICCHPALAGGRPDLGSGKLDTLFEILEPMLAEGHKVLVFSQFVRCLDIIESEMKRRKIPTHVLTGKTRSREEVVDRFQEDDQASVFLISLRAGGTGLNLTSASYVILYDPWWNPAVENQAIDRTHRIGQTKTVFAYRLVARGSVEEKILELGERKKELVRDVIGSGDFSNKLSIDDFAWILEDD